MSNNDNDDMMTAMPRTPEIERKRKANILKNQLFMTGLGIGNNTASTSGHPPAPPPTALRGGGLFPVEEGLPMAGKRRADLSTAEKLEVLPLGPLIKRWPGRGEQIHELAALIGAVADGVPVPPLLVTGPSATGKTSIVRAVLDYRGFSYVHVNCVEVMAKQGLLEAIVEQTAGSREEILEAIRVDRSFRDNKDAGTVEDLEGPAAAAAAAAEDLSTAGGAEALEDGERNDTVAGITRPEDEGRTTGTRGRQRLPSSSWNVFFRQLAIILARRSGMTKHHSSAGAANKHGRQKQQQQQRRQALSLPMHGGGDVSNDGDADRADTAVPDGQEGRPASSAKKGGTIQGGVIAGESGTTSNRGEIAHGPHYDAFINRGHSGGGVVKGGGGTTKGGELPAEISNNRVDLFAGSLGGGGGRKNFDFPRKLFVVLDNTEALLGEAAAGVGVSVGGSSRSWRGPDLLARLARLPAMVASFRGFGDSTAGVGSWDGPPSPPLICPILISKNTFFATEIMTDGPMRSAGGGGGGGRSLVASAIPVQLRFPPYSQVELPEVLAETAEIFGNRLDLNLQHATPQSLRQPRAALTPQDGMRDPVAAAAAAGAARGDGDGSGGSTRNGRKLFRKMAAAMVSSLRNETSDPWELGAEAVKLWPEYRKMAENGCEESELSAGLKKLLKQTTTRLHGTVATGPRGNIAAGAAAGAAGRGSVGGSSAKKPKKRQRGELGLSSRSTYLLVSAYLASHNHRDTDRDFFTARGTKKKKRQTGSARGNAANLVEAGVEDLPEAREFQLERVLSIMTSLVAASGKDTQAVSDTGSTELFEQLRSLARLNLISESGAGRKASFDLNTPAYRCNISRELAASAAAQIGVSLADYLS